MSTLVTGSLAYDYLMRVGGDFNSRLPSAPHEGGGKAFSAAYVAPLLHRKVGGCAGNIAYALNKLGDSPVVMTTVGNDFAPYADYLRELGVNTDHILQLPDVHTAQAYMITDENDSQFIIFHPGAAAHAHRQRIADLPAPPSFAIVSPNGKEGMLQHARDLAAAGAPFMFDPGQAIGLFGADELRECLTLAPYAIFNSDEFNVLTAATGLSLEAAAAMLRGLVITDGVSGSKCYAGGEVTPGRCVQMGDTADPTGCGDAYRAGLLYGIARGWGWQTLLNFAAVIAAFKAVHPGGQGYALTLQDAARVYESEYGEALPQQ